MKGATAVGVAALLVKVMTKSDALPPVKEAKVVPANVMLMPDTPI